MSAQIAPYRHSTNSTPSPERRRQPLGNAVEVALERYFIQLDGHEPNDLYRLVLDEMERPLLQCVLKHCGGNQTKAAKHLGLNRGTLRKKLKYHALD